MKTKSSFARFSAAMVGGLMLCLASSANAAIIYDVSRTIGGGSVNGTITTDGTLGLLVANNITSWS